MAITNSDDAGLSMLPRPSAAGGAGGMPVKSVWSEPRPVVDEDAAESVLVRDVVGLDVGRLGDVEETGVLDEAATVLSTVESDDSTSAVDVEVVNELAVLTI